MMNDIRYALRMLAKSPAFTLVSVLTLALGIGANTAIFSLVHSILLRPLPYHDSDQLVRMVQASPKLGLPSWGVSQANFANYREHNRSYESIAPRPESTKLSVSSWRAMRQRVAPRATRRDISRVRAVARANNKLATFAQAISSTRATADSNTSSGFSVLPTRNSFKGLTTVRGPLPSFNPTASPRFGCSLPKF